MKTLFVDSSRKSLSVALALNDELLLVSNVDSYSKHSNYLMNEIKRILEKFNLKPNDIDNYVVLNGPGSFTGVRVGVTVCKTLAWTLSKKIYKLNNLEALKVGIEDDVVISVIPDKKNKVMINESNIEISIKERFIGDREYKRKIYEKWLKSQCLSLCTEYIEFYYEKMKKYNVPFPKINAKNFKARWGCCIPKRNQVEFAINLVKAPRECVEYVVVHELAHFKYIHHDEKFYEFVSIFIPDWKKRRDSLNRVYGRIIG